MIMMKLTMILSENKMILFSAQNNLLQELITKEIQNSVPSINTTVGTDSKQLSFHETTVIDGDSGPMYMNKWANL